MKISKKAKVLVGLQAAVTAGPSLLSNINVSADRLDDTKAELEQGGINVAISERTEVVAPDKVAERKAEVEKDAEAQITHAKDLVQKYADDIKKHEANEVEYKKLEQARQKEIDYIKSIEHENADILNGYYKQLLKAQDTSEHKKAVDKIKAENAELLSKYYNEVAEVNRYNEHVVLDYNDRVRDRDNNYLAQLENIKKDAETVKQYNDKVTREYQDELGKVRASNKQKTATYEKDLAKYKVDLAAYETDKARFDRETAEYEAKLSENAGIKARNERKQQQFEKDKAEYQKQVADEETRYNSELKRVTDKNKEIDESNKRKTDDYNKRVQDAENKYKKELDEYNKNKQQAQTDAQNYDAAKKKYDQDLADYNTKKTKYENDKREYEKRKAEHEKKKREIDGQNNADTSGKKIYTSPDGKVTVYDKGEAKEGVDYFSKRYSIVTKGNIATVDGRITIAKEKLPSYTMLAYQESHLIKDVGRTTDGRTIDLRLTSVGKKNDKAVRFRAPNSDDGFDTDAGSIVFPYSMDMKVEYLDSATGKPLKLFYPLMISDIDNKQTVTVQNMGGEYYTTLLADEATSNVKYTQDKDGITLQATTDKDVRGAVNAPNGSVLMLANISEYTYSLFTSEHRDDSSFSELYGKIGVSAIREIGEFTEKEPTFNEKEPTPPKAPGSFNGKEPVKESIPKPTMETHLPQPTKHTFTPPVQPTLTPIVEPVKPKAVAPAPDEPIKPTLKDEPKAPELLTPNTAIPEKPEVEMYKLKKVPAMPALKELPKEPDCECPKRPELKPVPEFDRTMKLRKGSLPIKPSVRFTRTTVLAEDVTETPVETPKAPEVSHRVYYLDQETGDEVKPSETLNEGVNALELNAPVGYTFVRTEKLPNGDVKHYYKKTKVEPTKPSDPLYEKPAVEKPAEPKKPTEPVKPTEPIKPVEPTKPADDKKGSKVDVPTDAHNEPAIVEKPEDHKKGTKVEVPTDDTKKDVEPVKDVEPTKSDDTKKGSKLELPTDEPKELKEDPQDSYKATTKEDAKEDAKDIKDLKEDPKAKEEKPKDAKPSENKGSATPKEDAKASEKTAEKSTGKKLPETGDPISLASLGLASLIGARKLRRKK